MLTFIRNILYGAIIGITFIIPGMSGSTMAVMLGIYDDIIESISRFLKDWKRSILLLIPLGIGAAAGVFSLAGVVKWALQDWAMQMGFLFIGLMLGSIPLIYVYATGGLDIGRDDAADDVTGKHAQRSAGAAKNESIEKPDNDATNSQLKNQETKGIIDLPSIAMAIFTFLIMIAFMMFAPDGVEHSAVTDPTLTLYIRLFFVSFIACAVMVVPGISGALMFVIFGVYGTLMTAVSNMDLRILIPAVAGAFCGLIVGARLIDIALTRWTRQTYWGILGLVVGSVVVLVYEYFEGINLNVETAIAFVMLAAGIGIATFFGYFALKKNRSADSIE
jgi:putative membrane protein